MTARRFPASQHRLRGWRRPLADRRSVTGHLMDPDELSEPKLLVRIRPQGGKGVIGRAVRCGQW